MKVYWVILCVVLLSCPLACSDDASNTNNDWELNEDLGTPDMPSQDMSGTDMSADSGNQRAPLNHRPVPITCDNERPEGGIVTDPNGECTSDTDCTEGSNGRCIYGRIGPHCSYDLCFEDSDCDSVCECGGDSLEGVNRCVMGNCSVNADCGDKGYCSPSFGNCGDYSGVVGYFCHTAKDECLDDVECMGTELGNGYCAFDPSAGNWACSYSHCDG